MAVSCQPQLAAVGQPKADSRLAVDGGYCIHAVWHRLAATVRLALRCTCASCAARRLSERNVGTFAVSARLLGRSQCCTLLPWRKSRAEMKLSGVERVDEILGAGGEMLGGRVDGRDAVAMNTQLVGRRRFVPGPAAGLGVPPPRSQDAPLLPVRDCWTSPRPVTKHHTTPHSHQMPHRSVFSTRELKFPSDLSNHRQTQTTTPDNRQPTSNRPRCRT